jgi:hypothetical protein
MRRVVTTTLAGALLMGFGSAFVGCTDETGSKEEVKVTTPSGTTTQTNEVKIKKSGENPPPAPAETTKP